MLSALAGQRMNIVLSFFFRKKVARELPRQTALSSLFFQALTMFFLRESNKEHEFVCIESLVPG